MELQEVYSLMERFAVSGLSEMEWQDKDGRIVLKGKEPAPAVQMTPLVQTAAVSEPPAAATSVPQTQEENLVRAPLVGVFYAASAPGEEPFVVPGKQVKKGETLCLIEAMKMMSEIPAPADCVVEEVLGRDGEAVGFGEPLFQIRRV